VQSVGKISEYSAIRSTHHAPEDEGGGLVIICGTRKSGEHRAQQAAPLRSSYEDDSSDAQTGCGGQREQKTRKQLEAMDEINH